MAQLNFNERVTPGAIRLIDAAGNMRDDPRHVVDKTIVMMLPEGLAQGTHIISYRVVSEDGHPVAGSLVFSIGAVTGSAGPMKMPAPSTALIWLARLGVFLGLFVRRRRGVFCGLDRAGEGGVTGGAAALCYRPFQRGAHRSGCRASICWIFRSAAS